MQNALYYGDNLDVLRKEIKDETVDLVYLDPPFNSNANYNVLFKSPATGESSHSQIEAFQDSWHWGAEAQKEYEDLVKCSNTDLSELIQALRKFLKENDMMAYLVMMASRLLELHRVLKTTGSLYLHCDPTASHYLKLLLDAVFGVENYINEIVWKRSDAKGDAGQGAKHFGRVNDIILLYAKENGKQTFNALYTELSEEYINTWYRHQDPDGRKYKLDNMLGPGGAAKGNPQYEVFGVTRYWRYSKEKMQDLINQGRVVQTKPGTVPMYKRYLDESNGVPLTSNWADIRPIHGKANEKLGYPTQKPVSLLERIISASSHEGDVVLDPFCGCGTAVHAAEKLGRNWIGIDITNLSISLIERRLKDAFPKISFEVHGTPKDLESARDLANRDKYQFQWWAVSLVGAQPYQGKKKGADSGIDGIIFFLDDKGDNFKKIIVSVKGGDNVNVGMIRDLEGVMQRENAPIGLFVTLAEPSGPMKTEAAGKRTYSSPLFPSKKFPSIQILTIRGLLDGTERPDYPNLMLGDMAFKKAPVEDTATQHELFM